MLDGSCEGDSLVSFLITVPLGDDQVSRGSPLLTAGPPDHAHVTIWICPWAAHSRQESQSTEFAGQRTSPYLSSWLHCPDLQ